MYTCLMILLTQINNVVNVSRKLLDLIYTSSLLSSSIALAEITISCSDQPLCFSIRFLTILPFVREIPKFNLSSANLNLHNIECLCRD